VFVLPIFVYWTYSKEKMLLWYPKMLVLYFFLPLLPLILWDYVSDWSIFVIGFPIFINIMLSMI